MDPMIGSLRMEPRKADQNDDAEAEEKDTLLLPSHVLLDRPASVVKAGIEPTDDHGVSREDDSLMEGLHFVDDNMSKVCSSLFELSYFISER